MSIFQGNLVRVSEEVRNLYPKVSYDHRPPLKPDEPDYDWKMTEQFRLGYSCVKFAIAKILQPRRILEIGVCSGIAALAFLEACPSAEYIGLGNGLYDRERSVPYLSRAETLLVNRNAKILRVDSQMIESLDGKFDLVHVDGSHLRAHVKHDFLLALSCVVDHGFILCDDARDSQVVAGVFDALAEVQLGSTDWCYFEDTWTGNILYCKEVSRP